MDLLDLPIRGGHFVLESGLHSDTWCDLDLLFAGPLRSAPAVNALAARLAPYHPEVICGPLTGGAFLALRLAEALGAEFCYAENATPLDTAAGGLFRARYAIPAALHAQVRGRRVALVDDAISAGSSLRATHAALLELGARSVALGALIQFGVIGRDYFAQLGLPLETLVTREFRTWAPADCPLCALNSAPHQRQPPALPSIKRGV